MLSRRSPSAHEEESCGKSNPYGYRTHYVETHIIWPLPHLASASGAANASVYQTHQTLFDTQYLPCPFRSQTVNLIAWLLEPLWQHWVLQRRLNDQHIRAASPLRGNQQLSLNRPKSHIRPHRKPAQQRSNTIGTYCHHCAIFRRPLIGHDSNDREKPRHRFSCLPDIVGGLRYTEYSTSRMFAESEPPFTVHSLGVGSPNHVDRHHVMSRRIDDMMMPFKTEPHCGTTRAECMCS